MHEPAPDIAAAQVLGAQQSDSYIDADDIRVHPAVVRVEGVRKTIAAIDALAEFVFHCSQCGQADLRREHQRAGSSARHHRAVNGRVARRAAPRHITFGAIARRDAPDDARIAGKLFRQFHAEQTMRPRRLHRVLKVIYARRLAVAPPTIINPGVRVLMDEQRRGARRITVAFEGNPIAPPGVPRVFIDRVRR